MLKCNVLEQGFSTTAPLTLWMDNSLLGKEAVLCNIGGVAGFLASTH